MGVDLSALTDPQFLVELDYAVKQYAASVARELLAEQSSLTASELHQLLVEKVEIAMRRRALKG